MLRYNTVYIFNLRERERDLKRERKKEIQRERDGKRAKETERKTERDGKRDKNRENGR